MNRSLSLAACLALLAALAPAPAAAQEPPPNVLLLVDSSGSMEYKAGTGSYPQCDPTGAGTNERSRWIDLIEVLTGTIQNYRCQSIDRRSASFGAEFALPGGIAPLDFQYRNPYHRPLSGSCAYGPNNSIIDPNPFRWTEPFLHEYNSPGLACSGSFQQQADGLIDVYGTFVRFGLMTLDTLPHAGTGYSGTTAQYGSGVEGAWSYVRSNVCMGLPEGCEHPEPFEVGARNAAAPPWEGRLVPFGKPNPTMVEHNQRNQQVEKVLLTTRPYGGSPLAGLLHDAYEFLTLDDEDGESTYVGPQADPLVEQGCRKQAVILLTDGEPNLDLRPFCEATGGLCPFDRTYELAGRLAAANIDVHVVGLAPATPLGGVDCQTMTDEDILMEGGLCETNPGDRQVQACCTLHRIAFEGGTGRALFAEDQAGLRDQLDSVLADISGTDGTTSRTRPAVAPADRTPYSQGASAYRFLSGYETSSEMRGGRLVRQRYVCAAGEEYPKPPEGGDGADEDAGGIEVDKGDDFVANVESGTGEPRRFYTVLPSLGHPSRTVRPTIGAADPDGLGTQGGVQITGTAGEFVTQVVGSTPLALPVDPTASNCAPTDGGPSLNAAQCAERVLQWTLGLDNGTGHHRCANSETCSLIGAILRSTPRIVDYPNALTQDETYEGFVNDYRDRPMVLYTSTNDGFLHAFKVRVNAALTGAGDGDGADEGDEDLVDQLRNNELWAYLPPAVLPSLQAQYPSVYQRLLDGEPIVKDVVAQQTDTSGLRFERTLGSAGAGSNQWRTVLVQAFGEGWPGYFALDITDPIAGPQLLWQLTTAANGEPLFGTGGTPLITTVFVGSGDAAKEVAVAVLPGGSGGAPTGSTCERQTLSFDHLPTDFRPRPRVNCYPTSSKAAKSVTIVRLDSGEVLRTFRQDPEAIPASLSADGMSTEANSFEARTTTAPFDSPMTGRPVGFPSDAGAVADRIYLGDQDGTLWRIDVSAADPAQWDVALLFDAYAPASGTEVEAARKGQPIETPPILSMDEEGRITVNFSTGDQEALSASDTENYVWSISEGRDPDNAAQLKVAVNWYLHFENGERVVGPMVLMSSALYFTTFAPDTLSCGAEENGTSRIFGVDFTMADPEKPLQPRLSGFLGSQPNPQVHPGLVSGLALMQLPSCYESPETAANNAYFPGYASRPRPQGAAPGLFQLTFHTGRTSSNDGAGGLNAGSVAIAPPASVSRIDSWAAIVD